jgi:hypothetical protein
MYQLTNQGQSEARTGATGSGNVFAIGGNPNLALKALAKEPGAQMWMVAGGALLLALVLWRRK